MQALFVNNLTVIDFAYFHSQRGIVGESLILDVELFGELNEEGMLFDFSFVKKRIKSCVDSLVDHKFLVARQMPGTTIKETPQHLEIELQTQDNAFYQHISPAQAVHLIDGYEVNNETIVNTLHSEILKVLPANVTRIELQLRAEKMNQPYYHYSHGLKKHFGDCQRIAHGHRSRIEVWVNEIFSNKWSQHIAELWEDIYLATNEDLIEQSSINGTPCLVFQYHANQGIFRLTIPETKCYLINNDTTVELIASYLASYLREQIKVEQPDATIKIKAFEGVDKGAIAIIAP